MVVNYLRPALDLGLVRQAHPDCGRLEDAGARGHAHAS